MTETGSPYLLFNAHLFKAGCECPTKLYYKAVDTYPERSDGRSVIAHVAYNKHRIQQFLKMLYPGGLQIGSGDHLQQAGQTKTYIADAPVTLFDAAFLADRQFASVPVLKLENKDATILEIRTKAVKPGQVQILNGSGNLRSNWKSYLVEFAYRLYVIQLLHPAWNLNPFLVLPNKKAKATIDNLDLLAGKPNTETTGLAVENRELLVYVPVKEVIEDIWNGNIRISGDDRFRGIPIDRKIDKMKELYFGRNRQQSDIGMKCRNCEFRNTESFLNGPEKSGFRECWDPESDGYRHIFDLIGHGTKNLIDNNTHRQSEIPVDNTFDLNRMINSGQKITIQQRRQLQVLRAKEVDIPEEIIRPALFDELKRWSFPLHFIDFEAGNFAIPIRKGTPPYHQVVFQFSCHTLWENGELNHNDWIHTDVNTPSNYELVSALKDVPGITEGTIVQYSNFERQALTKIQRELDRDNNDSLTDVEKRDFSNWIKSVVHRPDSTNPGGPYLVDISRLVRDYYYNRNMNDSLGIKDILRSIMELSNVLKRRFSEPYYGSNFEGIRWWRCEEFDNGIRVVNPYEQLRSKCDHKYSIQKGSEAMTAYGKLRTGNLGKKERSNLIHALKQYCELDTLAMVMIYMHWSERLSEQ